MEAKYGDSKLHMMSPARLREPRSGKRRKRILKASPIKGYKQRKADKASFSDISRNQVDASGTDNEDMREKCADVIQDSLPIADSTEVSRFELGNISKTALIFTYPVENQWGGGGVGETLLLYGQNETGRRANREDPGDEVVQGQEKLFSVPGPPVIMDNPCCYPRDRMNRSPTYAKI